MSQMSRERPAEGEASDGMREAIWREEQFAG